jgi:hypothetical protein
MYISLGKDSIAGGEAFIDSTKHISLEGMSRHAQALPAPILSGFSLHPILRDPRWARLFGGSLSSALTQGRHMEEINYCDFCGELVYPDDVAPVKMHKDGRLQQFHYHNRHTQDCLAQKLSMLDREFDLAA